MYELLEEIDLGPGHTRKVYGHRAPAKPAPPAAPEAPPKPSPIPRHLLTPSPEAVEMQAGVNGHNKELAFQQLVGKALAEYARVEVILPAKAAHVKAYYDEALASSLEGTRELHATTANLNTLKDQFQGRANLLQEILATKADLDQAKATLDSPASLEMPGDHLAKLQAKIRHLPGKIAELESALPPITAEIARLVAALGSDEKALAQAFYNEANRRQGSGYVDGDFKNAFDRKLI